MLRKLDLAGMPDPSRHNSSCTIVGHVDNSQEMISRPGGQGCSVRLQEVLGGGSTHRSTVKDGSVRLQVLLLKQRRVMAAAACPGKTPARAIA